MEAQVRTREMCVSRDVKEERLDSRNMVSWRVPNEPLTSPSGSLDEAEKRTHSEKGFDKARGESRNRTKKKTSSYTSSDIDSEGENREDFQIRLWRFLFSNISRAVDELYNLCEDEENRDKCEESVEYFEKCKHDFEKLIERIENQKQFESDPSGAKCSISWEIRKPSGNGKRHKNTSADPDVGAAVSTPSKNQSLALTPPRSAKSIRTEFVHHDKTGALTPALASVSKLSANAAPFTPKNYTLGIASSQLMDPNATQSVSIAPHLDSDQSESQKMKLTVDTSAAHNAVPSTENPPTPVGSSVSCVGSVALSKDVEITFDEVPSTNLSTDPIVPTETGQKVPSRPPSAWVKPIHIAARTDPSKPQTHATINHSTHIGNAHEGRSVDRKVKPRDVVADDDFDEVKRESEGVWAKTEAWVEAEIQAEEAAWNAMYCVGGTSSGESTPRRWSSDNIIGRSIFGLEVDVEDGLGSGVAAMSPGSSNDLPGGKFSPKRQGVEDGDGYVDDSESPGSGRSNYTLSHRRLHEKLSSPDRYGRTRMTPEQARQKHQARQSMADLNRDKTVMERKQKAMVASNRVKASGDREAQRIALAEQIYNEKLREAEKRHREYIESVRGKAGNENTKVSEVLFINSLNEGAVAEELQRNLAEAEARIEAGRKRREDMLTGIRAQQRKRNTQKVEQMSELKLALAREKMERWEKIQRRLETVQKRRDERIAELQRRSQEAKEKADRVENAAELAAANIAEAVEKHLMADVAGVSSPASSKKSKKKSKADRKRATDMDDMELLNKIIQTTAAGEQPHDMDIASSLQGEYVDSAFTKFHLAVQASPAVKDRNLVLLSDIESKKSSKAIGEDTDRCSALLDEERGAYLRRAVTTLQTHQHVKLELATLPEGSEDTSTSGLHSGQSTSKRNKKHKKKTALAPPEVNSRDETAVVDIEHIVTRFDFENIDHLREFVDNGGLFLCRYVFDTESGCLGSSSCFREAAFGIESDRNSTLSSLCNMFKYLAKDSKNEANESSGSGKIEDTKGYGAVGKKQTTTTKTATTATIGIEANKVDMMHQMFATGACISVADMVHYLLLSFQCWGSSHFPRVLNSRNHKTDKSHTGSSKKTGAVSNASKSATKKKQSHDGVYGVTIGSPMTGNGTFHMSPMNTPFKSSSGEHKVVPPIDISWPPHLKGFLPSLLSVMSQLCLYSSRCIVGMDNGSNQTKEEWFMQATHWISYVSSSGLIECLGNTIRDVQCIAGNCCTDAVVFDLLTELSSFVGNYFSLLRLYRNFELHAPVVVHSLANLCVKSDTLAVVDQQTPTAVSSEQLCIAVSSTLTESEMSMHFIALLGTLLLHDVVHRRYFNGAGDSPSSGFYYTSGGGIASSSTSSIEHPVAPQVIILSYEILKTLNTLCRFDLRSVQNLPMDLQALSAHIAERLFTFLFSAIEAHQDPKATVTASSAVSHRNISRNKHKAASSPPVQTSPSAITQLSPETYEMVVELLLVYIGYLCLDCPVNQAFVSVGTPPCLLVRCCNLPVQYISNERLKHHLLPTLLSFCYRSVTNLTAMKAEMSPRLLCDIIGSMQKEYEKFQAASASGNTDYDGASQYLVEFAMRFPLEYWSDALNFFHENK